MPLPKSAAVFAVATASFALISCAEPRLSTAENPHAAASPWYEEQIEEGFGRLDQLPRNWTMLPTRHHFAWSVSATE